MPTWTRMTVPRLESLEPSSCAGGRLWVHPHLESDLRAAGFGTLEDILGASGELVSDHHRTHVTRIDATAGLPTVYRKVHRRRGDRTAPLQDAAVEWANLEAFASRGLLAPIPVALGVSDDPATPWASFLVTAALDGFTPLDELIAGLTGEARSLALETIAVEVARMHARGLTHPDLYARHVYLDVTRTRCAFLDVQRTRAHRRLTLHQRARDLAALEVSLAWDLVSCPERTRFLARYDRASVDDAGSRQLGRRELRDLVDKLVRRRRQLIRRGRGASFITEQRSLPDGQLLFAPDQAGLLDELGVESVSGVFGEDFARVRRTLDWRENAWKPTSRGVAFLKRHHGREASDAVEEWHNTRAVSAAGVRVARPICAGWNASRSFLLTLELPGEPLDDFLRRGRPPAPLLRELVGELAELVARLHGAGLCHRDLYLCHVFWLPDEPRGNRLALIDLHRVRSLGIVRASRWRLKDLAALAYSSTGLPISDRDRLRFLVRYLRRLRGKRARARDQRGSARALAGRITARSQSLLKRHGVPEAPVPFVPDRTPDLPTEGQSS